MSEKNRSDAGDQALQALRSGAAWAAFCDGLKNAGMEVLRPSAPAGPLDTAEGFRFLTRMVRCAFEHIMESGDAAAPAFFHVFTETMKSGWDNPDNIHTNAYINGNLEYRISGTRGDAHFMAIGVYGGSLGRGGGRRTVAFVDVDSLQIGPGGEFEVVLGPQPHSGNFIKLDPDASTLMIRETFWDRRHDTPAKLRLERLGTGAPAPLEPAFVDSALRRSLRFVEGSNKIFFDIADKWQAQPNTFLPSDPRQAASTIGIPGMFYGSGWWQLGPDEAIVLDVMPPACRYWSFTLGNYWGESLDYRYRPIHLNARSARYRPDGAVRIVLSATDPGLPNANWLDPAGHAAGSWTVRWLEAATHPLPEVRVVKMGELGIKD